jgi:cyclic pyranopterin phosphate synthase
MSRNLSHIDDEGRPRMVDVAPKPETRRLAVACGRIRFGPGVLGQLLAGTGPKGPVIEAARFAGVAAAKRTSDLIPLCHPLRITDIALSFEPLGEEELEIRATVTAVDRTGVEMEALCAVSVAALTVYDMVKAVDRGMVIGGIRLLRKEGGRSGTWIAPSAP